MLKLYVKQRMGWLGHPMILPYIGFGNHCEIYLRGRVIEDKGLSKAPERTSFWQNIIAMIKRYMSDEIPGVRVQANFFGECQISETNEYGEFEFHFQLQHCIPEGSAWHKISLTLLDNVVENQGTITAEAEVMISQFQSRYGIISDIDDTILISHSTSVFKKLRLMLLKNAVTRMPFEGVAAFYRALHNGKTSAFNPIFYVSSSEWNLYDLLVDFCEHQNIPKGTFMLKDLKLGLFRMFRSGRGKHNHKLIKIRHILTTFSHLNFILVGDSGQRDPEIYREVIQEFPGRILAVYIRDVSSKKRHEQVQEMARQMLLQNVEMLLVKDTEAAALHGIDKGIISKDTLIDIARERYKDQYSKSYFEQILGVED